MPSPLLFLLVPLLAAAPATPKSAPGAKSAKGVPAVEERAEAWAVRMCQVYASNPGNPWALAHGVDAFGPGFKASDGRLAVDVMVGDFVERGEGELPAWRFPATVATTPVDPHPNHTLDTLLSAGLPRERAFPLKGGGSVTLAELIDSLKRGFSYTPSEDFWREHAWTIGALASSTLPSSPRFTGAGGAADGEGAEIDVARLLDDAIAAVGNEQRFLAEAKAKGVVMVPKKKQFIWSHPCGGLHLIASAFAWMDDPSFAKRHKADLDAALDTLFFRLESETRTYEDALAKAKRSAPGFTINLTVQQLKFYGHWLETVAHLAEGGAWRPTKAQRTKIGLARALLAQAIGSLESQRAFERMGELEKRERQLYLDLIGDSCHAAAGLARTRGI